MHRVY
jgi:hypothetical protein